MRIKTIQVSYQRKLYLGDYESVALEASAWADLDPEEGSLREAIKRYNALSKLVRLNVMKQAVPFFKDGKKIAKIPEDEENKLLATFDELEIDQRIDDALQEVESA